MNIIKKFRNIFSLLLFGIYIATFYDTRSLASFRLGSESSYTIIAFTPRRIYPICCQILNGGHWFVNHNLQDL